MKCKSGFGGGGVEEHETEPTVLGALGGWPVTKKYLF